MRRRHFLELGFAAAAIAWWPRLGSPPVFLQLPRADSAYDPWPAAVVHDELDDELVGEWGIFDGSNGQLMARHIFGPVHLAAKDSLQVSFVINLDEPVFSYQAEDGHAVTELERTSHKLSTVTYTHDGWDGTKRIDLAEGTALFRVEGGQVNSVGWFDRATMPYLAEHVRESFRR